MKGRIEGHRLAPLLAPRSIAVVGASPRENAPGRVSFEENLRWGYPGRIDPVTPNHAEILGHAAASSLADLPEAPEMAILVARNERLEEAFEEAVRAGVKAVTIYASCYLEGDTEPRLAQRIAARAREAGVPICGANCMGFINVEAKVRGSWLEYGAMGPGGIALISHSGSGFIAFSCLDPRLRFNIAVSAGQELTVTAADYMDYALALESTRVIGLFLETVRDPAAFIARLERAEAQGIPVVCLKVGRTALSARLAESHSGALAGDDAAYEALFERHGVRRVHTMDEMAATLSLFEAPRRVGPGGLAAVLDSGGQRAMLIDLATDENVPFSAISAQTQAVLASRVDYGLEPVNPLDAWGSGQDYEAVFADCLTALAEDPDTALTVLFMDIGKPDYFSDDMVLVLREVARRTAKPIAVGVHLSRLADRAHAVALSAEGVPVLDGTQNLLKAAGHAFAWRDFMARPPVAPPAPPAPATVERWRTRLREGREMDEAEALALLADFGLPVLPVKIAESADEAAAAASEIGYPVALKTAAPGIRHKTEQGGVRLGVADEAALRTIHAELTARLGPRVLVAPMAGPGIEMALGLVNDPQFGPLVMVGAGGVLIELLRDRRFVMPPADAATARQAVDRLRSRALLDGLRGDPPGDIGALADAVARLAVLAQCLGEEIAELDVNPILVRETGCLALDALVVPRSR